MKWTKRAGAIAICIVLTAGVMSLRAKKIRTQAQDGRIATPSERDREFDAEIAKVREVSLDDFTRRFAPAARLAQISFDPTTAKYWDLFSLPPEKAPRKEDGPFPADFRLNKEELALFKKNGFVVSERMGAASFGEAFYRIYSRDLPVFISCDALLHAWHRSYDEILLDLEQTILHQTLNDILRAMSAQAPAAAKAYSNALLSDGLQDADYFLTVA
ncbi:MAG TPA: DUF3160 domain-containing protein, partial [Planctomycetota bacterium]|nr:DUF3160 domain-containing protein [Planctomycetota bacterium]